MTVEKWRLVGGLIYKLADVFESGRDAILLARTLKKDRCVVISKTVEGRWAVYWRARVEAQSTCEQLYPTTA